MVTPIWEVVYIKDEADPKQLVLTLIELEKTPKEQLSALLQTGILRDVLRADVGRVDIRKFRRVLGLKVVADSLNDVKIEMRETVFTIPDMPLDELVKEGRYAYGSPVSSKIFPNQTTWEGGPERTKTGILVSFNDWVTGPEAVELMRRNRLASAHARSLAAFGREHPRVQEGRTIVGLGDIASGAVPYLWSDEGRAFDVESPSHEWEAGTLFLAFKESALP